MVNFLTETCHAKIFQGLSFWMASLFKTNITPGK